ncbi:MAG TPA: endonuclease III [Actinomycetota bacterium]
MGKPAGEARAAWVEAEPADERKRRARLIYRRLAVLYPGAGTALHHSNPFELLIATVLSAQSTDATVNRITPGLFAKYAGPADYVAAKPGELEEDIRSSGYYNQKARSIRGLCAMLLGEFGGEVPSTMEELTRLPGVARKTANVVLGNAFGINEGIAVDTHVHRLSWRLGLSDHNDTNKVERELMELFPRKSWHMVTHLLIEHGRAICDARRPLCDECVLAGVCPASRAPLR